MRPPDEAAPADEPGGEADTSADADRPYWRLECLSEIAGRLLEGTEPAAALPALFERVGDFGIDCVYSYRVTRYGDRLELDYAGGRDGEACHAHPSRLRFGEGICGTVALVREALHVTHIQRSVDPRFQSLRDAGLSAYACEPVMAEGRLFGLVAFASRSKARFAAADLLFFQAVARHLAFAFERRERELELRECNRELQHRVNNVLSTVQSIVILSSRTARDPEHFAAIFGDRLVALGKTHNLLTKQGQRPRLRDLLHSELKPYDEPGRVRLRGHSVRLPSSIAIFLGIAIHELVSNSANFGALGAEHGQLHVTWWLPEGGCQRTLIIDWRESGAPTAEPPRRRGFGSRLLEGGLGRQIRIRREFSPSGLHATIEVVLN